MLCTEIVSDNFCTQHVLPHVLPKEELLTKIYLCAVPFSMNKILKNKIRAEELMASSVEAWKVSAVIMFSLFSTYSLVP